MIHQGERIKSSVSETHCHHNMWVGGVGRILQVGGAFIALGLLLIVLLVGCRPPEPEQVNVTRVEPVTVVSPDLPSPSGTRTMALLQEVYPHATYVPVSSFASASRRCLQEEEVLILPDAVRFPVALFSELGDFVDKGGRLLLLGRDPFKDQVVLSAESAVTESDWKVARIGEAIPVDGFSSVELWRHMNESGVMRGSVRAAKEPGLPWPGVVVDVEAFQEWDTLAVDMPGSRLSSAGNALALYARGDASTSCLVLLCEEADGSVWSHTLRVSSQWGPFLFRESTFEYFHGGTARGGDDDQLDFAAIVRVSVGLSMHLAPQSAGGRQFGVSDVRMTTDSRPEKRVDAWPDLFLISPSYRNYETTTQRVRSLTSHDRYNLPLLPVQGPLPRPRGRAKGPYRWIPLYEAMDGTGGVLAWPVSLCVSHSDSSSLGVWGWIGVDTEDSTRVMMKAMIGDCVRRMQNGSFFLHAGSQRSFYTEGEHIEVHARWVEGDSERGRLRIAAELVGSDGRVLRRVVASPKAREDALEADLNLGVAPVAGYYAGDYEIRVALEYSGVHTWSLDEIRQPIKVAAEKREVRERDWLRPAGSRFLVARQRVYLFGVNYWPLSTNGRPPAAPADHWLEVGAFDATLVRRDLDRLQAAGFNALAIQYLSKTQAPQLRYFIEEARSRGMWICLYVNHLSPFDFDPEKARELIEAAGLAQEAQVFAFDLAWEPHLGRYAERCRFDDAWRAWLVEQYGSVRRAERMLDFALWRRSGDVTGPSDRELVEEGSHGAAIIAYRRFVDDLVSRRYGAIRRFLRSLDCGQSLTARTGYGGTGSHWAEPYMPLDPVIGAVHLDFLSPESWGVVGERSDFMEAGFITAYARGMSAGKPVVWMEFGVSVGRNPGPQDLLNQSQHFANMFDMCGRSQAAGSFAWWYPGGCRVDEQSDMGIVRPDGRWRPVGEVCTKFARYLQSKRHQVGVWHDRAVDRWSESAGLSALWDEWRDTYRAEMEEDRIEELRPLNFGRRTTDLRIAALGGGAFNPPEPMRSVNAEWGDIRVSGSPVLRPAGECLRLEGQDQLELMLINTGPATWMASEKSKAGTVWVRAEAVGKQPEWLRVSGAAYGEQVEVRWSPGAPGTWTLRPFLQSVGAFGEALIVVVPVQS